MANQLDSLRIARYHAAMQHVKPFLSVLSLVALVSTAAAETSPEAACAQLRGLLEREVAILQSVQDAQSAAAALSPLSEVLRSLGAMDRSYEAEKALWTYIDNTEGVKMPLVELLQRLCVEFARIERAVYFENRSLRAALLPQLRDLQGQSEQRSEAE